MDAAFSGHVTGVLRRIEQGDRDAYGDLLPLVYGELRRMAGVQMGGERPDHTLQPTALVSEAVLRLMQRDDPHWENRTHFYKSMAAVMRRVLVNHARDRGRLKRGGDKKKLPLDDAVAAYEERAVDLLALDEALTRLEQAHPRRAMLVELRFFGGLSISEAAELLGISERTATSEWGIARELLWRDLTPR